MIKFFKNPFYTYVGGFTLVILFYSLKWSGIYPPLSISLVIFFFGTFGIALILGFMLDKHKAIAYQKIRVNRSKALVISLVIIYLIYILEMIVNKGCPLWILLDGNDPFFYRRFGVKYLHVFVVTFNTFFLIYSFHYFLSNKSKKTFLLYLLGYIPALFIVNRSIIVIGVLAGFFVFALSREKKLNLKENSFFVVLVLLVLFIFGILGVLRTSTDDDPDFIYNASKANTIFTSSKIAKPFYWSYLYATSPLANFQHNINQTLVVDYDFPALIVNECMPKIVSNRLGMSTPTSNLFAYWLTADSVYSMSYSYAKWFGPILMFVYHILFIPLVVFLIPKRNEFHVVTIAILLTLIFLNIFDNMFSFSGIILMFFYPLLFSGLLKFRAVK